MNSVLVESLGMISEQHELSWTKKYIKVIFYSLRLGVLLLLYISTCAIYKFPLSESEASAQHFVFDLFGFLLVFVCKLIVVWINLFSSNLMELYKFEIINFKSTKETIPLMAILLMLVSKVCWNNVTGLSVLKVDKTSRFHFQGSRSRIRCVSLS